MTLKAMRRTKGWSQEQLSEASGVSVRTIQRLEKGEAPGLETQKALAATFELTLEDFTAGLADGRASPSSAPKDDEAEEISSQIGKFGWRGLLLHLCAMMLVMTWLLFLSRDFGMDPELVGFIGLTWGVFLAGHLVLLLSARN